jgi:nucleotide-binding universal stress UspA family protein
MRINRLACASRDDVRNFTFCGARAMKILLAVDGSASTHRMLATLAAHDEMLRGDNQYTALTVLPLIPPHAAAFLSRASIDGWYLEEAGKVLAPVQAFGKQNAWALDVRHVAGHAGDEIVALCDKGGFDMIVMGTHGHSALGNVVMGSTATRVLARSRKPVLLIP